MSQRQWTLGNIAQSVGLELRGEPSRAVRGVATLATAAPDQIAFLANPHYRRALPGCRAAAVILAPEHAPGCSVDTLLSDNPYAAFARVAALFEVRTPAPCGVHPSAVVDASATVSARASIGPLCCIGARTRIADGAVLGAGCIVGDDCHIGIGCVLAPRVTLVTRVRLGQRVRIHSGAVLGADGFGIAMDDGRWLKVPQLGGVCIGDDCEIGANTTIDRGAIEDTELAEDVRLDNQIQIGHNVRIGAHTAMAGCVAVAGSTRIGRYCLIGGAAGIVGHIEIVDRVTITAMSLVTHSILEPGEYSSGTPLQASRLWRRNAARFKHLDALARRWAQSGDDPDTQ
jgi:UDP-3-O-[3-hydroxymyristoyl] glucosamine N-acyltransferase